MFPYKYKRSSRSWANYTFGFSGLVCFSLSLFQFQYHWFGRSGEPGFSLFFFGILLFIAGAAGLIKNSEWEMQIDEHRLLWRAAKNCGEVPMDQIKKMRVEEGDGRCLTLEMANGTCRRIPGECYGNASELSEWLRRNFGNHIEISS